MDALDPRIVRTIDAMERRMAERLMVRDLAAIANLSPSRFAHLFRKAVGRPPLRYLNDLRLERARELLLRTTLLVSEVTVHVGYPDPSHFSRDFRTRFGVGPREYRSGHIRNVMGHGHVTIPADSRRDT